VTSLEPRRHFVERGDLRIAALLIVIS